MNRARNFFSPDSLIKIMNKSELILNPFLKLEFFKNKDETDCILFSAPTLKVGVQTLELSSAENPELYELFEELSQTSLNFLDIAEDLSDDNREMLARSGILIAPEAVSQPPLFVCFLDEVVEQKLLSEKSDLIVNPSLYYEEASDYETIMRRRKYGFEPRLPVVWVTCAKTEITFGYWLRGDFLEIIKNLEAGKKLSLSLTEMQIAVLRAVEILVEPNYQTDSVEKFRRAVAEFQTLKYATLREILPPPQLAAIRCYVEQLLTQGFLIFNDRQVSLRHAIHNDPVSIYFHEQLASFVSRLAGEIVKPSYVYSAIYVEDAVLAPHTDRPQCEFTMSMQIGYEPELSGVSPWALCLNDLQGNKVENFLANGDALIYKGCELVHYRDALFKNHRSTSIFFHFVPQDFEGSLS